MDRPTVTDSANNVRGFVFLRHMLAARRAVAEPIQAHIDTVVSQWLSDPDRVAAWNYWLHREEFENGDRPVISHWATDAGLDITGVIEMENGL